MTDELSVAKKRLFDQLGEDTAKIYSQLLRLWFLLKISKEEFDKQARKLLDSAHIRAHNNFLLCLFTKCCVLANDSPACRSERGYATERDSFKRTKMKRKTRYDKGGFEAIELFDYIPSYSAKTNLSDEQIAYCVNEPFIPDAATIMPRLLIIAWERGLDSVDDKVADLIILALKNVLKNVLTAVFTTRSNYRLREGQFVHGVGQPVPNHWSKKTQAKGPHQQFQDDMKSMENMEDDNDDSEDYQKSNYHNENPSYDDIEQEAAFEIACSQSVPDKHPVDLYALLDGLEAQPKAIANYSVYILTMEHIIARINHPTREELETDKLIPRCS